MASSFEDRILAAAVRLAEAHDEHDEQLAGEQIVEIIACARGILARRVSGPPEPRVDYDVPNVNGSGSGKK